MRRFLGLLCAFALIFGGALPATAAQPITVMIDGRPQTYDQPPVVVDGHTMVPLRAIFEALGAAVRWDGATQTVTATRGTRTVTLTIGEAQALVDGRPITLAAPAQIIGERTMVPLRFVGEALGAEVQWLQQSSTVDITTNVGGTVTFAMSSEPEHLLPILAINSSVYPLLDLVYDPLIRFDDRNQPHPSLARSWRVEQDRIYTFSLRDDVTWHDGQPFTARDAAFTFQAIAHPFYTGPLFDSLLGIKGVKELTGRYATVTNNVAAGRMSAADGETAKVTAWEAWRQTGGIQAVDDTTFRVEVDQPFAPALEVLGGVEIMPEHLLKAWTGSRMASAPQGRMPVGTGPYRITAWSTGDRIELERNPAWKWGALNQHTRIQHLTFKYLPSTTSIEQAAASRSVDVDTVNPDQVELFRRQGTFNLVEYQPMTYTYLGYNLRHPVLQDVNVRRAFTHALDREAMVQQILLGRGTVIHSSSVPGRMDFTTDLPVYGYSVSDAGRLLDAAGWTMGADGVRRKDGAPLTLELTVNNKIIRVKAAEFIQAALKKIGVTVTVRVVNSFSAYLGLIDAGKVDLYINGWSLTPEPDDAYAIFHSAGAYNTGGYHNPRVDELLELGRRTLDQAARVKIYQEVNRLLAQDQPMTWLFAGTKTLVYSKRIQGIMADRAGYMGPEWHIENWYVTDSSN
jgi:peptide/nickel transport system substrate-binding protein